MGAGALTCLMFVVVALNAIAAAAGLALFAVAIWVAADGYKLYPISGVSGKDDIFAAAWIAIFTGFAFFLTCIFGIFAALKRSRGLILIVMFIIFLFECASAITAATNRDYVSTVTSLLGVSPDTQKQTGFAGYPARKDLNFYHITPISEGGD